MFLIPSSTKPKIFSYLPTQAKVSDTQNHIYSFSKPKFQIEELEDSSAGHTINTETGVEEDKREKHALNHDIQHLQNFNLKRTNEKRTDRSTGVRRRQREKMEREREREREREKEWGGNKC
jgi:hypothetical protein